MGLVVSFCYHKIVPTALKKSGNLSLFMYNWLLLLPPVGFFLLFFPIQSRMLCVSFLLYILSTTDHAFLLSHLQESNKLLLLFSHQQILCIHIIACEYLRYSF